MRPHTDRRPSGVSPVGGNGTSALVLSLVHPDFLPSVYSLSFVLRDAGYDVDVVTFSSPVQGSHDLGPGITLNDSGPYAGSTRTRARARAAFAATVGRLTSARRPAMIIATCPFSYLEALRVRRAPTRVVYYMLETYDVTPPDFLRSPLTALRSKRALRRIAEADLVCTPSWERSGWLAGLARLRTLPATVLNSPSYEATRRRTPDRELMARLLPVSLQSRPLVIHTGGLSATQCVLELIDSVPQWPEPLGLVITNVGDTVYGERVRRAAARSDRIALLPTVTRRELHAIQGAGAVGLCLLRSGDNLETVMPAPNKVGEYLHNGLTIVGLRMAYLAQMEIAGIAVLADDLRPEALAAAVTIAWQQHVQSDGRARALAAASTWYCMETQARPILRLIGQSVMENT